MDDVDNIISEHDHGPISLCKGGHCYDCETGVGSVDLTLRTPCRDRDYVIHYTEPVAKLSDLVPVVRELANEAVLETISASENQGCEISCRKGCNACCHYMVSVSSAEAFRIRDEINQLPSQQRKSLVRSSVLSARYILRNRIPHLSLKETGGETDSKDIQTISQWYASLNLACPLLSSDICSLYESRPLVCREHMVTSEAFACKSGSQIGADVLRPAISFAEVLTTVCNKLEGVADEAVLLPLSLAWCEANIERDERIWPTDVLLESFVTAVNNAQSQIHHLKQTSSL